MLIPFGATSYEILQAAWGSSVDKRRFRTILIPVVLTRPSVTDTVRLVGNTKLLELARLRSTSIIRSDANFLAKLG
jgi:hypothetical protein